MSPSYLIILPRVAVGKTARGGGSGGSGGGGCGACLSVCVLLVEGTEYCSAVVAAFLAERLSSKWKPNNTHENDYTKYCKGLMIYFYSHKTGAECVKCSWGGTWVVNNDFRKEMGSETQNMMKCKTVNTNSTAMKNDNLQSCFFMTSTGSVTIYMCT